jgi:hypothetical protein
MLPCWPPCPGYFAGTASADGVNTPIVGDDRIVPPWPHPADTQPPEWSLSIGEITAYGAAWRRGETWPLPPNPIPIDYVTRAAFLWRGGECYRFDNRTNAPRWWVNCDVSSSADFQSAISQVSNQPAANRQMTATFVPGEPLTITISITSGSDTRAYAVEDTIPTNWTVAAIAEGGEFDAVNGQVKWGPFLDSNSRAVSYQVTPPASASGIAVFTGAASFDGASVAIGGARQLRAGSRLTAMSQPRGDSFSLTVTGELGRKYVIEASTDLITWTPLLVVTNTLGRVEFSDSAWRVHSQRFYRATSND